MKKNISINISGIIFHIEEDGYEKLKEYLSSINKYFSTFDDSKEIIADIESRIAEIFLSKLSEGKQVITAEDVTALMATMGGIHDFQAVEEEPPATETTSADEQDEKEKETASSHQPKRFFRDKRRRLIGGVAAGIAHYFSVDPLWIRLVFIVIFFDVFITSLFSGIMLATYILLWIVLPESDDLEEDKHLKKMYRNPEGSVIGGVANGVAAYFELDVAIIRVLFVLTIFAGGVGLITYLVLWIILPEARSITDKVQMKGKAVTLENIDSNIKSRKGKMLDEKDESVLVKVLLFPFRIIAIILKGIAYALGPIFRFVLEAVRVIAGLLLIIIGLSLLFSVLISAGVFVGLLAGSEVVHMDIIPLDLIQNTFPAIGFIAAILVLGVPSFALLFLGVSIISKSRVISATVGWAMFALWLIGLIVLSFTVPSIIYNFRSEATYSETRNYELAASVIVLAGNEAGTSDYNSVRLKLRGYDGNTLKIIEDYSARGSTKQDAFEEAKSISYTIDRHDSTLVFDTNIIFDKNTKFRDQELMMTLFIPYGQTFIINDILVDIIYNSFGIQGYGSSQIIGNTWVFNPSGLDCQTCEDHSSSTDRRRSSYEHLYQENLSTNGNFEQYDYSDFKEVSISGPYIVNLVYADSYRVVLEGSERYLEKSDVGVDGDQLNIIYKDKYNLHRYNRRIKVKIMTPTLYNIKLRGSIKGDIIGFEEDNLSVDLAGAVDVVLDADIYSIDIDLKGASQLELIGSGEELDAGLSTASYLDAYSYKVKNAKIDASGLSKAKVYASQTLEIHASLVSEVKYRGGAKVNISGNSSLSHVERD